MKEIILILIVYFILFILGNWIVELSEILFMKIENVDKIKNSLFTTLVSAPENIKKSIKEVCDNNTNPCILYIFRYYT